MEPTAHARIETFWKAFQAERPEHAGAPQPEAWAFGDNPALADELCQLVLAGVKTGTCCSLNEIQVTGEPLPQAGMLSIILNGAGDPVCVIETTSVEIKPFNQVDADFAASEGEGDRSYEYWYHAHWTYFTRTGAAVGQTPTVDMPIVCERFKVLWKEI